MATSAAVSACFKTRSAVTSIFSPLSLRSASSSAVARSFGPMKASCSVRTDGSPSPRFPFSALSLSASTLPTEVAAYMAAIQEHLFSVLLVIGLASRLSALGLFGMTMVIQFFVYPANWPDHLLWSSVLLYIIARGPGAISLDYLIRSAFERNPTAPATAARVRDPSTVGA